MKCKFKEVRRITPNDLRNLCVKNGFYTDGNNEEYENLLSMCNNDITLDIIYTMAQDIFSHSDYAVTQIEMCGCLNHDEVLKHIMFLIADVCYTYYE